MGIKYSAQRNQEEIANTPTLGCRIEKVLVVIVIDSTYVVSTKVILIIIQSEGN